MCNQPLITLKLIKGVGVDVLVIKFSIYNSRLRRIDSSVISPDTNKVKLEFDFRTDDWSAVEIKTANIYYNGENHPIELDENNQCFVPPEVLYSPSFKVSVFGGDIVTNTINILIDGDRKIEPSAYEKIIKLIDEHTHEEYVEDDELEEITLPDTLDAGIITERG